MENLSRSDNRGSQRAGGALAGYVTTHTCKSDSSGLLRNRL